MSRATRPTEAIREMVDELLERNQRTADAKAAEMYLGKDVLVVRLARPCVIEGQWEDVDGRTADIFDLMDMHNAEAGR